MSIKNYDTAIMKITEKRFKFQVNNFKLVRVKKHVKK